MCTTETDINHRWLLFLMRRHHFIRYQHITLHIKHFVFYSTRIINAEINFTIICKRYWIWRLPWCSSHVHNPAIHLNGTVIQHACNESWLTIAFRQLRCIRSIQRANCNLTTIRCDYTIHSRITCTFKFAICSSCKNTSIGIKTCCSPCARHGHRR